MEVHGKASHVRMTTWKSSTIEEWVYWQGKHRSCSVEYEGKEPRPRESIKYSIEKTKRLSILR